MKLSQKNKLIMGGIGIALVLLGVLFLMFNQSKDTEGDKNLSNVIRIQQDHASLTGVVQVLDGEVIEGEEEGKTTFKAEGQEIITTIGSDVVMVNGEERPYVKETIQTEDDQEDELETTELPVVYEDEDEVFVPIEFVEDVFDLTYDEESLEFKKEDEVILVGEKTEDLVQEEMDSEVNSPDDEEKEESKEEEKVEETEESKEEETVKSEKPNSENTTNQTKPENTTNSTSNSTKPENAGNSGSSNNTENSGNSNNTGSSSNTGSSEGSNNTTQTKPETTPTPTPEPQPVKVTSLTTSTGNLTLEVGGSAKMNVTVNPSNADNKGVTFTSSNTGVATVDGSGNIVAKGAGTATITAKSNENGNIAVSISVTVNEKPKPQPTYTGSSIVNRVVNELGWCKTPGYENAFLGEYGCDTGPDRQWVYISAMNGTNGYDLTITIKNSSGSGVVSGVESILRWMLPTKGQQIINKLHDSSFYGGTFENMDGRKVVVSLESYGIAIDIYPKY